MMVRIGRFILGIAVAWTADVEADDAATRNAVSNATLTGGLAVFVGSSDGAEEIELAHTGRWLVLSIAPDEASSRRIRDAVEEAKLSGLVTVAVWQTAPRLPLGDHMANLVVADLDSLPADSLPVALSEDEVRRVLAPVRGRALIGTGSRWRSLEKPMPTGMDEWTHFFHGPDGNAVSRDTAIGVPNALRFIAGPRLQDSNGANGYRLSDGIAVSEWNYTQSADKDRRRLVVEGRDAHSGVLLWQKIEPVYRGAPSSVKTKPMILADGRLLRMVDDGEESARIGHFDPGSGELVRVYQSSRDLRDGPYKWSAQPQFNYHDGLVVQAAGRELRCFDARTDELRWSYEAAEDRGDLYRPIIAADLGRVIVLEGPSPEDAQRRGKWKGLFGGRYPAPVVDHIVAVDLKTGNELWRVERDPRLEQLHGENHYPRHGNPAWQANARKIVYHVAAYKDGRLFLLFACDANGGGPSMVLCHDARSGKQLWYTVTMPDYDPEAKKIAGGEMFDMFLLDDGTIFTYGHQWARIDQATGKLLAFGSTGGNARCDTGTCTANLVTAGFGNYFDISGPEPKWTRRDIARGQCGGRSTPAYGMTYHHGSGCGCFFMIRGNMALRREEEPQELPDEERLTRGPAATSLASAAAKGDWPVYLATGDRRAWTGAKGPARLKPLWKTQVGKPLTPDVEGVRRDWLHSGLYNGPTTSPIVADGLVIVADRDGRRVVALDEQTGRQRWSYSTDGRVFNPPTFCRGRIVFGTRGGQVHCLDVKTGEPAWTFLAAPTQRFILAYGQVESAWPLHGSLPVVGDTVIASAGYHGEVDGGVWVWGLDLATGEARWKRRLFRPERPWKSFTGEALKQRIADDTHPLAEPNKSNGQYHVTRVRNVDLPSCSQHFVRTARVILDPTSGETADFSGPDNQEGFAHWTPIVYGERFPFLDMEFEARGGPHSSGGWTMRLAGLTIGDHRGGRMRIVHDGARAVIAKPGGERDEQDHYIRGTHLWWIDPPRLPSGAVDERLKRLRLSDVKPRAFLPGMDELDSLVVAGSTAYLSAEGRKPIPWGNGTRMITRDVKGEPIPGRILAVALPDGKPLGSLEIDSAVVNNGLAVAGGRLYASCEDGTVRCFGE